MSLDPRITAAVLQTRCPDYMNPESECDGPDGCAECCERVARAVLAAAVAALPEDADGYALDLWGAHHRAFMHKARLLRALTGDDGGGG